MPKKSRKTACTLCKAPLMAPSEKERKPWQSRASMLRRKGYTISVQCHDKRADGVTVSFVGALCSSCGKVAIDLLLQHGFLAATVKGAFSESQGHKEETQDAASHTT